MAINASSKNAGEVPYGEQRERLPGGPGPAAAAHPLQEGAVRRPRWLQRSTRRWSDDRRTTPHDQEAQGNRDANGRKIGECRSARDQDADRRVMKDVEHQAGDPSPPPEPRRLAAADKEVVP